MRRLLLVSFVLAAAIAAPAAANPDGLLCLGVTVWGEHVQRSVETGAHCVGEEWRRPIDCHDTYVGVRPWAEVRTWSCFPFV